MIKKFKILLILILLLPTESIAFSPEYEREMYIGCYGNSKQYLGADGAKTYCLCVVDMLSNKYSNEGMDLIFKKKPEEIIEATKFAVVNCENK
tara:strand:- start:1425 stop:1703 length:279 start_codon:yes stop_codon:yes gene_type:complete